MNNKKSRTKVSDDKLTVEYEKEEFISSLPNLASELIEGDEKSSIPISGIRHNTQKPEDPKTIDYIRRCTTDEQVLEILGYLEKRGEISHNEAVKFQDQLKSKGIASFGKRKTRGHYEREYRR